MTDQGPSSHMQSSEFKRVLRDQVLASIFRRQQRAYSTRTSEGFVATLLETDEQVVLWQLRFPLAAGAEEDVRFISRMDKLTTVLPRGKLHSYGVDQRGTAFAALRVGQFDPVLRLRISLSQRLLIWRSIVAIVANLHEHGICLGDIAEDSFVWNTETGAELIGIMGTFDSAGSATAMLPPPSTLQFLAPEQRGVSASEPMYDVFALGVYGYRLITGIYPFPESSSASETSFVSARVAVAPSLLVEALPHWVDPVFGKALEHTARERFQSASELLGAIDSEGAGLPLTGGLGVWSRATTEISQRSVDVLRSVPENDQAAPLSLPTPNRKALLLDTLRAYLPWGIGIGVGSCIALLLFWLFSLFGGRQIEPYSEAHRSYVPPELEQHLAVISDRTRELARRSSALRDMARLENQFVMPIMATLVRGAFDEPIRQGARIELQGIVDRAGMPNVALALGRFLESKDFTTLSPEQAQAFLSIIRSTDAMQTMDARLDALRRAHTMYPAAVIGIAAALAVDTSGQSQLAMLRELLINDSSTLCREPQGCEPRERVGALLPALDLSGLLLAHPQASYLFTKERLSHLWIESRHTQAFVLEQLFLTNSEYFPEALQEGMKQGGLSSLARPVVALLGDEAADVDTALSISLLRGAVGVVEEEDVFRFQRWKAREAAKTLIAVSGLLVRANNNPRALDVFDIASNKQVLGEAERSLLQFVRSELWNQRARLILPVAIVLFSQEFSSSEVHQAIDVFEKFSVKKFFEALLKTQNAMTIKLGLERFSAQLPSAQVIPLLRYPNPEVRIEAARALAGRNEFQILQAVLSAYDSETNPEVRRVYQQLHWVTKGR